MSIFLNSNVHLLMANVSITGLIMCNTGEGRVIIPFAFSICHPSFMPLLLRKITNLSRKVKPLELGYQFQYVAYLTVHARGSHLGNSLGVRDVFLKFLLDSSE